MPHKHLNDKKFHIKKMLKEKKNLKTQKLNNKKIVRVIKGPKKKPSNILPASGLLKCCSNPCPKQHFCSSKIHAACERKDVLTGFTSIILDVSESNRYKLTSVQIFPLPPLPPFALCFKRRPGLISYM